MGVHFSSASYNAAHNPYQRFNQSYAVQPAQTFSVTSSTNNRDIAPLQFGSQKRTLSLVAIAALLLGGIFTGLTASSHNGTSVAGSSTSASPSHTPKFQDDFKNLDNWNIAAIENEV